MIDINNPISKVTYGGVEIPMVGGGGGLPEWDVYDYTFTEDKDTIQIVSFYDESKNYKELIVELYIPYDANNVYPTQSMTCRIHGGEERLFQVNSIGHSDIKRDMYYKFHSIQEAGNSYTWHTTAMQAFADNKVFAMAASTTMSNNAVSGCPSFGFGLGDEALPINGVDITIGKARINTKIRILMR